MLVVSERGKERGAVVVITYLMISRGMYLDKAYLQVKQQRPCIGPANRYFRSLLRSVHNFLYPMAQHRAHFEFMP